MGHKACHNNELFIVCFIKMKRLNSKLIFSKLFLSLPVGDPTL